MAERHEISFVDGCCPASTAALEPASSDAGETGSSRSAPIRKHRAPSDVNTFAAARSSASPVEGTTYAATAETPKATQPTRFTRAIHQSRVRRARPTSSIARQPETRKQIEPRVSGVHTSRSYSFASSPLRSASNVEMLKNTVPASWIALLHQSMARGRNRPPWTYCSVAADVK